MGKIGAKLYSRLVGYSLSLYSVDETFHLHGQRKGYFEFNFISIGRDRLFHLLGNIFSREHWLLWKPIERCQSNILFGKTYVTFRLVTQSFGMEFLVTKSSLLDLRF